MSLRYQGSADKVIAAVDSDWAGCVGTRRSTSGGVMKLGMHTVKTWASTQASVALSSGEAVADLGKRVVFVSVRSRKTQHLCVGRSIFSSCVEQLIEAKSSIQYPEQGRLRQEHTIKDLQSRTFAEASSVILSCRLYITPVRRNENRDSVLAY